MKIFKNPKLYIIAGMAIVLVTAIVASVLILRDGNGGNGQNTRQGGDERVLFYGFSDPIDLNAYLPLEQAKKILAENDGIAIQIGQKICYVNGDFRDFSQQIGEGTLVSLGDGGFSVDAGLFSAVTGKNAGSGAADAKALADRLEMDLLVYGDKLLVFLKKGADVNVFDNYYTFEMISLKLRNAPLEDFENALLELPSKIGNGKGLVMSYTDPDLELGLSSSLYALQGYNSDYGTDKISPRIVAGEGEDAKNHTVIRVYNEFEAKTAQFLAFPAKVTGGVRVACASVSYQNQQRGLIAAAAFDGSDKDARYVKVFDEYGLLYMTVKPSFCKDAPYAILTGQFVDGVSAEQLLITPAKLAADGTLPFEIRSLENGECLKEGVLSVDAKSGNNKLNLSLSNRGGADDAILFDRDFHDSYLLSFRGEPSCKATGLNEDTNSGGVYRSAFDDKGYVETVDADAALAHQAFVRLFSDGDVYGTKTDVGVFENIFYWDTASSNLQLPGLKKLSIQETDYVKKAAFQHIRTDLAARCIGSLSKKKVDTLDEVPFSNWKTTVKFNNYAKSYNVWEPCFTHRLNKTPGAAVLADYKDRNGVNIYMGYTKEGETADYHELDSAFFNATYAEGILVLDKMRIYPLRDTLQKLYEEFRLAPEMLAGLEPIHEIEISVGDSVGDYNPNMVEGFRSYLLSRFGSVENVNRKFGTSFGSREEIDAPRNTDRGEWDKYKGDYFVQWSLYTRKVVNKRLAESFREAMLAGFPADIISGHSIPEGDAVSGFLGQADTRCSPVDAMMTLGCHFGATRYGTWFQDEKNYLNLAYRAGFRNVTMGEYNSMSDEVTDTAVKQLRYLWSHGGKFTSVLNVSDSGTRADLRAIQILSEENKPRPGYAEGTSGALAVKAGENAYEIVELGGTSDNPGLLKSVDKDGRWTGDVYLIPFHSQITVEEINLKKNVRGATSDVFGDLQTGDVLEVNFLGNYTGTGTCQMVVEILEDDMVYEAMTGVLTLGQETMPLRYVLSNQVPLGKVKVRISFTCEDYGAVNIVSLDGSVQRESIARKFFGDYEAAAHRGGVTFDVLSREHLYGN